MQIDMNYTSQFFTEQLNKFSYNHEDIDPDQISSQHAKIDMRAGKVTRNLSKKYKFDAKKPFENSTNIIHRDNKYFLQVKITNTSTIQLFPTYVNFLIENPAVFELNDLNEGIFDSSAIFHPDEIRSYLFII